MLPSSTEMGVKVFISYAHADQELRQKLEDHLSSLKYSGKITIWQDQEIPPGANWKDHINTHLEEAHLILLLVSSSFMASDYCWNKEVQAALERHKTGKVRVVPIILKPVHWQNTPLGHLQALPTGAKPVTEWNNQDAALEDVTRGIQGILEELRNTLGEEAQGSEAEAPFEGRKAALIVGVNNTQHSSLLPNLKFAEDDAHEIAYVLRTPACNFLCHQVALTGEKAEMQAVRRAVMKLARRRATQDLLLFYFLGHALPMRTSEGRADICLVTYDFDEAEIIGEPGDATAYLSLRWLSEKLYRPDGAARVLIILDCSYSEKMVHASSDPSPVDVSQILKECIGPPFVIEQNGRWRVLLTVSTSTTPTQERKMTPLLVSALQGKVREAADHKGHINIPSLYTYLQTHMPQEHLPDLPRNFPQTCSLAYYHYFSDEYRSETLQAEQETLGAKVSKLSEQLSEVHSLITDPQFFERIGSPSAQSSAEYFDHWAVKNASLDDLHREKIIEFFTRNVVQRQKDFRLGVSYQDQLRHFGFLREVYPTYGVLLCFGLNPTQWLPGASTRCILWFGNDTNNGWLDDQDYPLDLIAQFESGRQFLQKHLRLTREIGRDERSEKLEIPLTALEEALANALVHREYRNRTASVSIDIFTDRIEMSNPGTLPEPMTLDLLEEAHKSHPRNPQIARIFYLHQYVEKVGSGIQRMQRALRNAGLEPAKFEVGKDKTFKVTFYRPKQDTLHVQSNKETMSQLGIPQRAVQPEISEEILKVRIFQLSNDFLSTRMKGQVAVFRKAWEKLKTLPLETLGTLGQTQAGSIDLGFAGSNQQFFPVISTISWVVINWPTLSQEPQEQMKTHVVDEAVVRGCSRTLSYALANYLQAHLTIS